MNDKVSLKLKKGWFIPILFIIVSVVSCKQKDKINLEITEIPIVKDSIVSLTKNIPNYKQQYFASIINSKSENIITGIYNDSTIFYHNLETLDTDFLDFPLKLNIENSLLHFSEDYITILHDNNLLSYNILNSKLDTFSKNVLDENEFPKKNIYDVGIKRLNTGYLINFGIDKLETHFIDKNAAYFILENNKNKLLPYPAQFESYVHYNDLIICNDDDYIYYTFNTGRDLIKAEILSNTIIQKTLPDENKYLEYDFNKITDMTYLVEYSNNTKYNLKMFNFKNFITLITYEPAKYNTPSDNEWIYFINIFSKDLNFIDKIKIEHPVMNRFIHADENYIYFIYTPNNMIHRYKINIL